jgi:hypothetical protein
VPPNVVADIVCARTAAVKFKGENVYSWRPLAQAVRALRAPNRVAVRTGGDRISLWLVGDRRSHIRGVQASVDIRSSQREPRYCVFNAMPCLASCCTAAKVRITQSIFCLSARQNTQERALGSVPRR